MADTARKSVTDLDTGTPRKPRPRLAVDADQGGASAARDRQQQLQYAFAKPAGGSRRIVKLLFSAGMVALLWAAVVIAAFRVGQMS